MPANDYKLILTETKATKQSHDVVEQKWHSIMHKRMINCRETNIMTQDWRDDHSMENNEILEPYSVKT